MEYPQSFERIFTEWSTIGQCAEAIQLNSQIGTDYFDTANPHYFTGNLNSKLVLVHLNPKRARADFGQKNTFKNFDQYLSYYTQFGSEKYGPQASRKHKSPFDHKQIRFLQPFGLLPFKEDDVYHNLEVVIDQKLQLELVPFGSPDFDHKKIGATNLSFYIDRLLDVISAYDRDYVIFCGKVFSSILKPYIVRQKIHRFKLEKNDGTMTKSDFEVRCIQIRRGDISLNAAIAPQFAKQGYPVRRYGEKVKELYGSY